MDIEWKADVSRKLDELSELQGLRKNVQRITVAIEKLAGIKSQDSEEKQFLWPASEGKKTKVQESSEKEKQREKKIAGSENENNRMKGMEKGISSFL